MIKKRQSTKIGRIKLRKIISIVNDYFDVNCLEKTRKTSVVIPRQIAMYFCRKNTTLSSPEIGLFFNKDHATVLYSLKCIENYILTDKNIRESIKDLDELILSINFKTPKDFRLFKSRELIFNCINKMNQDELNALSKILVKPKKNENTNNNINNINDNYLLHYN